MNELQRGGQKLYLTITTKPLSVALLERHPAVHVIVSSDTTDLELANLLAEAQKYLEVSDGTA